MAIRILVVAEAPADWRMVAHLIDRKVLHYAPDLMQDAGSLEAVRIWCGIEADSQFTSFSRLKKLAFDEHKSALRGAGPIGFSGSAREGFEWASVKKVLILARLGARPAPDAIVYSRDMDRRPRERKESIENAISTIPDPPFVVVLALANPKREAWILNGFIVRNAAEEKRLSGLKKELGLDPCEKAEEVDVSTPGALKDAKRVLKKLTDGDHDRESECLNAPWETLRKRGKNTGLAEFLEQVKDRIVPLVTGQSPRS
jgi:hypothetical protein